MAEKHDLQRWIVDALRAANGSCGLVEVARHIWANHEEELRSSGPLFFTWQYDMRWAATALRRSGAMLPAHPGGGPWELVQPSALFDA